ncbi:MAG: hypothetical protein LC687_04055 [Actinobacteria bacterium]|nr:hypothetical protein [Actinomycetota bacterium]
MAGNVSQAQLDMDRARIARIHRLESLIYGALDTLENISFATSLEEAVEMAEDAITELNEEGWVE